MSGVTIGNHRVGMEGFVGRMEDKKRYTVLISEKQIDHPSLA
ncbi:MAG: hypothetical protein AAF693_19305 [Bacteroidota bacterium]